MKKQNLTILITVLMLLISCTSEKEQYRKRAKEFSDIVVLDYLHINLVMSARLMAWEEAFEKYKIQYPSANEKDTTIIKNSTIADALVLFDKEHEKDYNKIKSNKPLIDSLFKSLKIVPSACDVMFEIIRPLYDNYTLAFENLETPFGKTIPQYRVILEMQKNDFSADKIILEKLKDTK